MNILKIKLALLAVFFIWIPEASAGSQGIGGLTTYKQTGKKRASLLKTWSLAKGAKIIAAKVQRRCKRLKKQYGGHTSGFKFEWKAISRSTPKGLKRKYKISFLCQFDYYNTSFGKNLSIKGDIGSCTPAQVYHSKCSGTNAMIQKELKTKAKCKKKIGSIVSWKITKYIAAPKPKSKQPQNMAGSYTLQASATFLYNFLCQYKPIPKQKW